jgi:hypothetical protein
MRPLSRMADALVVPVRTMVIDHENDHDDDVT